MRGQIVIDDSVPLYIIDWESRLEAEWDIWSISSIITTFYQNGSAVELGKFSKSYGDR